MGYKTMVKIEHSKELMKFLLVGWWWKFSNGLDTIWEGESSLAVMRWPKKESCERSISHLQSNSAFATKNFLGRGDKPLQGWGVAVITIWCCTLCFPERLWIRSSRIRGNSEEMVSNSLLDLTKSAPKIG